MKTISFRAMEFGSVNDAMAWSDASGYGDCVIGLNSKRYLTTRDEADRLGAAGVSFAYLHPHTMPDGSERVLSVPIN